MKAVAFIFIIFCYTSPLVTQDPDDYCPIVKNKQSELGWTRQPATLAMQIYGRSMRLYCCAEGFSNIMWYRQHQDKTYQPFKNDSYVYVLKKGEILVMTSVSFDDAGNYKCQISSESGETKHFVVELKVLEHSDYHQPPEILVPRQNITVKGILGSNLSLQCDIFFGNCNNGHDVCDVIWQDKHGHIIRNNTSPTKYTQLFKKRYGAKTSILTISGVKESDYGTYTCQSVNSYGNSIRFVQFVESYPVQPRVPSYAKVLLGVFGSLLFVFILSSVLYQVFKLDIQLLWKMKFGKTRVDGAFEHDVMVVYNYDSERDKQFGREFLITPLEEKGYLLYNPEVDILGNQSESAELLYAHSKSCRVIMYVTQDFIQSPKYLRYFHETDDNEYHKLIFILNPDMSSDKMFKNVKNELNNENDESELNRMKLAVRYGRTLKYPSQDKKRELQKFWKRLCLELPRKVENVEVANANGDVEDGRPIEHVAGARNWSNESRRPLLQSSTSSQNESDPVVPYSDELEIINESPNDEVFQDSCEIGTIPKLEDSGYHTSKNLSE